MQHSGCRPQTEGVDLHSGRRPQTEGVEMQQAGRWSQTEAAGQGGLEGSAYSAARWMR
jgi:hypothetical protein